MCLTYEGPLFVLPSTDVAEIELIRFAEQWEKFLAEGIRKYTLFTFKSFGDATENMQIKSMDGM